MNKAPALFGANASRLFGVNVSLLVGALALAALPSCAAPTGFPKNTGGSGGEGGSGGATASGGSTSSGGTTASGGATSSGGAGGSTGGSTECGTALDQTGCPCTSGEAPRSCFTGSAAMAGVGACSLGTQACVESQNGEQTITTWGACTGQGSPSAEVCGNGNDEDCDGAADEGCPAGCTEGATQSCSSACGSGTETCVGGQWVNCNAPPPNGDGSCTLNCNPAGAPPTAWEPYQFSSFAANTPCNGARYVRYMDEYALWVGAVLCTPTRYKLYLSTTKDGTYYQMGDYAGNGQDHCEMVNDAFTIPNEDDVMSGGCAACALGDLVFSDPGNGPVFSRATFGTCFDFEPQWPQFNLYSVTWYECGVSIP